MQKISKFKRSLTALRKTIKTKFCNNSSIVDECVLINISRIYYMSFIVIPSRIVHILFFATTTPISDPWSRGIIISHSVLLVFWIVVFFITRKLKNEIQTNFTMHVLQYIIPIVVMASGVIIVTIDQLVTTNITPFLLVSIVIGAAFLIRPLISGIIYIISYIAYFNLIALTVANEQILLSNRVNGTTAIGIGFLISLMIWHYKYINITQTRQIKTQQKQLEQMAYYDQLTNLYNRHFFNKMIEKEFHSTKRYGYKSSIIILDIDNFKDINDTYGHLVGDEVLIQLAKLILNNTRKSDIVARFGGEEFIILAPNTPLDEGYTLAEKLRRLIAEHPFPTGPEISYITASFGVSLLQETKNQGIKHYYFLADNALYLAKREGKNRVKTSNMVP